jgi:hypothetical protein
MAIEHWTGEGTPPAGQGWKLVGSPRNGDYQRDTTPAVDPTSQIIQQIAQQYNLPADKIIPNYQTIGGSKSDNQQLYSFSYIDPANNTYTNFDPNGKFLETHKQGTVGGSIFDSIFGGIAAAGKPLTDVVGAVGKAATDNPLLTAALIGTAGLGAIGAAGAIPLDVVGGADAAAAELATSAAQGGTSLGDIGSMAGTMGAGGTTAAVDPTIAAMGGSAAAVPAAGMSANEAVAAGMAPGAAGATAAAAGALTPAEAAAAAGTVGAGSALADVAAAGNTAALASGAGGILGGLSGTQLATLGTGAAGLFNAASTRQAMQDALGYQQGATAASQKTLGDIYSQQLGYQAPYQAAGVGAVNQLAGMNPYLTHQFNAADLQAGLAPNYDFMLQQGQQANQRAANVGGGALGGNALTGLNQFTQNYAGNAYQNAFNNYQTQRTGIYNTLAGIAGIGQTANTGAGLAGQNFSQGTVGLNTGLANAQAASTIGQSQATSGGISNLANTAFLATLLGQKG